MKRLTMMAVIACVMICSCRKNPLPPDDPPTEPERFTIQVTVDGQGEVILIPQLDSYEDGSEVQVTAIEVTDRWSYESFTGALTGMQSPQTLVMDSNKFITAVFRFSPAPIIVAPIILNVPKWYVSVSNLGGKVSGSEFTILEDGKYVLTAELEYSEESPFQDKEHVYFNICDANIIIGLNHTKPLISNHSSGEFVVFDKNDNEHKQTIQRQAGVFQLPKGDYFINVWHGVNVIEGQYIGPHSVRGTRFVLDWLD